MNPHLTEIVNQARNGDRLTALTALRAYVDEIPDDPEGWLAIGALTGDYVAARTALKQALVLRPDWPLAQRLLENLPAAVDGSKPVVDETEATPQPQQEARTSPQATEVITPQVSDPEPHRSVEACSTLTVERVRKVYWPFAPTRRKKRPIGELVDNQLITRQDLMWAAENARNQRVRDAAVVLLGDSATKALSLNLSLKDALQLQWPFRQLNRPLGDLLREGTLQSRDLRRAAFFAKNANLREAARMALRRNLDKQPPVEKVETVTIASPDLTLTMKERSRFPMRIVNGDDYLAHEIRRREAAVRRTRALAYALVSMAVVLCTAILVGMPRLWYVGIIIIALCAGSIYWLRKRRIELEKQIGLFQQGLKAELSVARYMREFLDDRWTLFRNVKLPGTNTDIDLVLLGPPGVFAIEIKAYKGTFRYKHGTFYRYSGRKWRNMRGNPGKQARATAGILHAYIGTVLHSDVWVEPRLVWAGPGALELIKPEVFVWYMSGLQNEMQRLKHLRGRLSNQKRAMVYGMLSGLSSTHT